MVGLTVNPSKEMLEYLKMDEQTYRKTVGKLIKDGVIKIENKLH